MINTTLLNNANNNIKNTKQIQTEYLSGYNRTDNYNYGGPPLIGNNPDVYKNTSFNMLNNMKGGMSDHNYGNQMFKRTAKSMKIQDDINEGRSLGNQMPSTNDDAFQTVESSLELFFNDVINAEFTNEPIKQQEIRQTLGNFRTYGLNISKSSLTRYSKILEESIAGYLTRMDNNSNYFIETYNNLQNTPKKALSSEIQIAVKNLKELSNQELLYKLFLIIQSLLNSYGDNEKSRQDVFKIQYMDIIKANPIDIMPSKYIDLVKLSNDGLKDLKNKYPNIYKQMDKEISKLSRERDKREFDNYGDNSDDNSSEDIDTTTSYSTVDDEDYLDPNKNNKNTGIIASNDTDDDDSSTTSNDIEYTNPGMTESKTQPGGEAAGQTINEKISFKKILEDAKKTIKPKPKPPAPKPSAPKPQTRPKQRLKKPEPKKTPPKIKGGRSIKFVDKMLSSWGL